MVRKYLTTILNKGYISSDMYADYLSKLAVTQNSYDIYMEHTAKKYNPVIYSYTDDLKTILINLRKTRSTEMNIQAYYIYTNEELDKLVELKPKTIEELNNILTPIKVKTHGEVIIKEIRK